MKGVFKQAARGSTRFFVSERQACQKHAPGPDLLCLVSK
jgi:hypothetical protein